MSVFEICFPMFRCFFGRFFNKMEYISNHNHETFSVGLNEKSRHAIQTDKDVFWSTRHVRACRHVKLMPVLAEVFKISLKFLK